MEVTLRTGTKGQVRKKQFSSIHIFCIMNLEMNFNNLYLKPVASILEDLNVKKHI